MCRYAAYLLELGNEYMGLPGVKLTFSFFADTEKNTLTEVFEHCSLSRGEREREKKGLGREGGVPCLPN